jgi:hypothetical protein
MTAKPKASAAASVPAEERVWVTFVATGKAYDTKGEPIWTLYLLDDAGAIVSAEKAFGAKNLKTVHAGNIYRVKADSADAKFIYPSTVEYVRPWAVYSERMEYQARMFAFDAAHRAKQAGKKEATRNLLKEQMAPLRAAWQNTNYQGRTALEVLVLNYLRTGQVPGDN